MKKLKDIIDCDYDTLIFDITTDSRRVKPGFLFVATRGFNIDHFDFIDDAIDNGAVAIITNRIINVSVPVVVVDNINDALVSICQKFYNIYPDDFSFIGITGTDGKTTTSSIIKQLLNPSFKTAYIGTNGLEIGKYCTTTDNTTPCVEDLYGIFCSINERNCKDIVMEVSSEALLHKRVDSISYDIVGFTNITEDHLNVHKSIDNYIKSKEHLVDLLKFDGYLILNGDDINCKDITYRNMYTYGFNSDNDYVISNVNNCKENVSFDILFDGQVYSVVSPLSGKYNIYNVTLAFIICVLKGIDADLLIKRIGNLSPIYGRREFLNFGQKFDIVLDYAHTFNGIKNLVGSFDGYNRIILVTGAAGGREKEKRQMIGKFLLDNVSFVIFTMDDPRYENPRDIIDDMLEDTDSNNYEIIIDRTKAIYHALDLAFDNDLVLVIGKGRDNYMAIMDKKIKYCDYDVIKSYFKS